MPPTPRLKSPLHRLLLPLLALTIHLPQRPTRDIVHDAMHLQAPPLRRLNHITIPPQHPDPLPHILLHQPLHALLLAQPLQRLLAPRPQRPQRQQPGVDDADLTVAQRGVDAAAGAVAAQHDVLHAHVRDGVLDHRGRRQVARVQDVGDVAVHEDVAGLEARDGRFGHARVGAAEPEDLGRLAFGEGGEEGGVVFVGAGLPGFVAGEEALEGVWGGVRLVEGGWMGGGLREAVGLTNASGGQSGMEKLTFAFVVGAHFARINRSDVSTVLGVDERMDTRGFQQRGNPAIFACFLYPTSGQSRRRMPPLRGT